MDGTTSAVNYLFSPNSNDYYDHHTLQPIQSLAGLPYYQSDAIDCLYEHHKSDFQSPSPYIYHSAQQQQQQQSYGYGPSIYDIQSSQQFVQESNLLLLQNQPRLPSVYELSPPCQTLQSVQLQSNVGTRVLKREVEDPTTTSSATTTRTSEKGHVFEWMKGIYMILYEEIIFFCR
jgi:hypothetical protein